mgnify:CR=1 FL=1
MSQVLAKRKKQTSKLRRSSGIRESGSTLLVVALLSVTSLLAILAFGAVGLADAEDSAVSPAKTGSIFYTVNNVGYIEPCG